ncbi:hypothetical protein [Hydrogenimonas cancrithermarum]|uniref:Uncharacterized protein n=1 Tax=Hydrogenimonas cancrithermarum TaxID=2993563 RepID=A0ABN6WXK8_9BACT|nr:hypothetical protein [Hydrogenimonas cancrithermarum]BDY12787.1 hypothetical protein HCR_10990 [Hydrogenimonas cancrithermarum]
MKLYYYINTGHRIGLDRLRRSAPVINALSDMGIEVSMLTNDFRAGEYAKEQFGIRKYVSVDVVRNIANIATPADALVFDSEEESRAMWADMATYFRSFIRISDNPDDFAEAGEILISSMKSIGDAPKADIVDPRYFEATDHGDERIYFWGDDDYDQELLRVADAFEGLDITLLEGYYFFMQYGSELAGKFKSVEDSENYDEVLMHAGRFLSSSPQSVLEALAAGSNPLYLKKSGISVAWDAKMESLGIPVLSSFDKDAIEQALSATLVYRKKVLRKEAASEVATYIKDNLR